MRKDISKLLDEFAANRLTKDTERALADAAMADQDVFDALLQEQMLKELATDPYCRQVMGPWLEIVARTHQPKVSSKAVDALVGRITDVSVSESIVTLDIGANLGLCVGDHLNVCRWRRAESNFETVGYVILREVEQQKSIGYFIGASGAMIGDLTGPLERLRSSGLATARRQSGRCG